MHTSKQSTVFSTTQREAMRSMVVCQSFSVTREYEETFLVLQRTWNDPSTEQTDGKIAFALQRGQPDLCSYIETFNIWCQKHLSLIKVTFFVVFDLFFSIFFHFA